MGATGKTKTRASVATHTPGPWVVAGGGSRSFGLIHIQRAFDCKDRYIASVSLDRTEYEQRGNEHISRKIGRPHAEQDARLIAAAPDHHDAAREIDRLVLVIESAVRNADPGHHAEVLAALRANRAAIAKATGQ